MNSLNKEFGLSSRVKLELVSEYHIGIVKQVKSRIIQKDAVKIIEVAQTIRNHNKSYKISLICNDNICSKSVALLQDNDIQISFSE